MSTLPQPIVATRWWWVRHAPVPDGGRIYGQGDLDCDCSRTEVFKAVAAMLPSDAVWVTSSLKRTHQTAAAIIAASQGRHTPTRLPAFAELAEQHFGDWQGQHRDEFRKTNAITPLDFWLTKGTARAPNGESFPDLVERVTPVIERLTQDHAGRNIVAVTHGGTIRAAIQHALGATGELSHAFHIDNCSVTVLDQLHDPAAARSRWRVMGINTCPWGSP
jgi:alpha-ribazole phosphatase